MTEETSMTEADVASLAELLAQIDFLSALSAEQRLTLAQSSSVTHYELGDGVVSEGDQTQGLLVVVQGRVRLFQESGGKEASIGVRKSGDVLGELGALRNVRYEFSCRASSATKVALIPAAAFAAVFRENSEAEDFMSSHAAIRAAGGVVSQFFELGSAVDTDELKRLVASVGIKSVAAGTEVITQDTSNDRRLYVIRQGRVRLVRQEKDVEYPLATLVQGEIFGEKACLLRQAQLASARAETDLILLIIPEDTVRAILEHNPRLRPAIEDRIQFLDRELARQKQLREKRGSQFSLDVESRSGFGQRVLERFPLVQQAEEMDCGAACLAMVCKYFGIPMGLGKLRDLVNVSREGASLDSVAKAAESLGFSTRGVQSTLGAMKSFDFPLIAHWEGYHFVVVYGISSQHVWIADPGPGFRKLTIEEFEKGWTGTCLLFKPANIESHAAGQESPWKRFVGYLAPHRSTVAHLFLAALVIQLLGLAPPVITQNILDKVIVHENAQLLLMLTVGLVLSQLFAQLTTIMRGYLAAFMTRSMDFAMMSGFFQHAMALPVAFFANRRTGDVIARFQENQTIRDFLTGQTVGTVLNVMMVFVYLTVMFMYNVKLTLIMLALVIPIFVLTVLVTPRMKEYSRKIFETSTEAEGLLMETVSAAESVKAMGIERQVRLSWERKYANALNVQYDAQGFQLFVAFGSQLLNIAATVAILYIGANMVIAQELSVGQLIAFNMLASSVMTPLLQLVSLWDELHAAGIAMERLGDVLDLEPEQKPAEMSSRIVLPQLQGDVSFKNVYFRYGDKDTSYVLEDINLEIKQGELVALVGRSGSGKSTLAKLLVGFYPPTEGKILVDGYDLNLIETQRYRAQLGYVMQSNLLFQGTIAENIAMGDEDPDKRRIVDAAELADAHGFISNLPRGYEQEVGERGTGLSGGQVQRLCIARALYRDPRILILDEATSSLDTESESNILSNMDGILQGRTALVIAHRLSTIMRADKILVLYNGAIAESGTHEELLAAKGMYFQLVQKQIAA